MPQGNKPRFEPEIIPPDRAARNKQWSDIDAHGAQRVYVMRLGPLGVILVLVITAVLSAAMLALLLGALFLFWLPLLALIVAGVMVTMVLRTYFGRTL
jgi:uncharacterized membrane protein